MAEKYKRLITNYCQHHGIAIPPGFGRNTPSRYVIIRINSTPQKLIATTWFKVADVLYHIDHVLLSEFGEKLAQSIRILDFQESEELAYSGGKRLHRVATFSVTPGDATT